MRPFLSPRLSLSLSVEQDRARRGIWRYTSTRETATRPGRGCTPSARGTRTRISLSRGRWTPRWLGELLISSRARLIRGCLVAILSASRGSSATVSTGRIMRGVIRSGWNIRALHRRRRTIEGACAPPREATRGLISAWSVTVVYPDEESPIDHLVLRAQCRLRARSANLAGCREKYANGNSKACSSSTKQRQHEVEGRRCHFYVSAGL